MTATVCVCGNNLLLTAQELAWGCCDSCWEKEMDAARRLNTDDWLDDEEEEGEDETGADE